MIVIGVALMVVWAGLLAVVWPATWPWWWIALLSPPLGLMTFWILDTWSKR